MRGALADETEIAVALGRGGVDVEEEIGVTGDGGKGGAEFVAGFGDEGGFGLIGGFGGELGLEEFVVDAGAFGDLALQDGLGGLALGAGVFGAADGADEAVDEQVEQSGGDGNEKQPFEGFPLDYGWEGAGQGCKHPAGKEYPQGGCDHIGAGDFERGSVLGTQTWALVGHDMGVMSPVEGVFSTDKWTDCFFSCIDLHLSLWRGWA